MSRGALLSPSPLFGPRPHGRARFPVRLAPRRAFARLLLGPSSSRARARAARLQPRGDCAVVKFFQGDNAATGCCPQCFCFVCDVKASECAEWARHCDATRKSSYWTMERQRAAAAAAGGGGGGWAGVPAAAAGPGVAAAAGPRGLSRRCASTRRPPRGACRASARASLVSDEELARPADETCAPAAPAAAPAAARGRGGAPLRHGAARCARRHARGRRPARRGARRDGARRSYSAAFRDHVGEHHRRCFAAPALAAATRPRRARPRRSRRGASPGARHRAARGARTRCAPRRSTRARVGDIVHVSPCAQRKRAGRTRASRAEVAAVLDGARATGSSGRRGARKRRARRRACSRARAPPRPRLVHVPVVPRERGGAHEPPPPASECARASSARARGSAAPRPRTFRAASACGR